MGDRADLDLSLDDIISANRSKGGRGGSNTRGRGSPRGAAPGGMRRYQNNNNGSTRSSSPYGSRPPRQGFQTQHFQQQQQQQQTNAPRPSRNNLVVTNLDYNVTEEDLNELFGQIGPLKRVYLHLGPNGTSSGVADIFYTNSNDAERAITTYNHVELDGRPMRISFANLNSGSIDYNNRPMRGGGRGGYHQQSYDSPRGGRGGGNFRGTGRRQPNPSEERPQATQEDLDAEMDKYMTSTD
ncbi:hypothetical protein BCR43DRAFT_492899 [Syncephalastrum racemosum]|uniref:RRM domain-containing protein n=1 Tax=Syncephalastrum racemosum TaxID=13706 RepID=A0A1X2H9Q1_SYNRA|nr:hypothetical protein BCR43DRAFT_492899 [Syncephalastrum racemosum]